MVNDITAVLWTFIRKTRTFPEKLSSSITRRPCKYLNNTYLQCNIKNQAHGNEPMDPDGVRIDLRVTSMTTERRSDLLRPTLLFLSLQACSEAEN